MKMNTAVSVVPTTSIVIVAVVVVMTTMLVGYSPKTTIGVDGFLTTNLHRRPSTYIEGPSTTTSETAFLERKVVHLPAGITSRSCNDFGKTTTSRQLHSRSSNPSVTSQQVYARCFCPAARTSTTSATGAVPVVATYGNDCQRGDSNTQLSLQPNPDDEIMRHSRSNSTNTGSNNRGASSSRRWFASASCNSAQHVENSVVDDELSSEAASTGTNINVDIIGRRSLTTSASGGDVPPPTPPSLGYGDDESEGRYSQRHDQHQDDNGRKDRANHQHHSMSSSVLASCDTLPCFTTAHGLLCPEVVELLLEKIDKETSASSAAVDGPSSSATMGKETGADDVLIQFLHRYRHDGPMSCIELLSDPEILPHLVEAMREIDCACIDEQDEEYGNDKDDNEGPASSFSTKDKLFP